MKKTSYIVALVFFLPAWYRSSAQDDIHKVRWYEVEGEIYYQVKGCVSGSTIAFYSERCGGRLLKTIPIEKDQELLLKAEKDFQPAFAHNNGPGGNRKTAFFEEKAFTIEGIELSEFQGKATLHWKATVGDYTDYEFEVLKEVGPDEYLVLETTPALPGRLAPYDFAETSMDGNHIYRIRLTDKHSGWSFTSRGIMIPSSLWNVYPTLAQDQLNILVDAGELGSSYKVMDIYGRTWVSGMLKAKRQVISVKSLIPGYYFIQLSQNGQRGESKRFIKL